MIEKIRNPALHHQGALLLIASFLALIPFRRLSEIPMVLMALLGLGLLCRHRQSLWRRREIMLFSLIFAAFWVPIVISLVGAINPGKTFTVAVSFLRLYLAGLFIINVLAVPGASSRLLQLCAWVLLVWVLDALLQAVTGYNTLGYPQAPPGRVSGFFTAAIHLGMFLVAFCPLLFIHARRYWPFSAIFGVMAGTTVVILISGSRASWISLGLVFLGLAVWMILRDGAKAFSRLAFTAVLLVATFAGSMYFSQEFSNRVGHSLLVFSADSERIDQALSGRLPIWQTAINMINANPLNGVGARNFRYAYETYAEPDDPFVARDTTIAHVHQLILDVGSETGLIGLAGLTLVFWLLLRTWHQAGLEERRAMLPYALGLLVFFFPINTHNPMYSSVWAGPYFWLLALYCATAVTPAIESDNS